MRIFLIRHPEPIGADGICYGRTDLLVEPRVAQETAAKVKVLLPEQVDAVISSPLSRCVSLASLLSHSYSTDTRLVELDFGHWESVRWDDIDRGKFNQWANNYVHRQVPGGESWDDVLSRTEDFLTNLRAQPVDVVAVVTHAGVFRAMLSLVLGVPLESTWRIRIRYGAVAEISIGADTTNDQLISLSTGMSVR